MKTRQTATDAGARRITKNELESLNTALLVGHTVSITQTLPNLITGNKPAVTLVVLWSFTATIPQPKFREAYLQRYRSLVYPLLKRLRQEWIRTAESVKPADLQVHFRNRDLRHIAHPNLPPERSKLTAAFHHLEVQLTKYFTEKKAS